MKITKKNSKGEYITYEGLVEIIYAEHGCLGCLFTVLLVILLLGMILDSL